MVSGDRRQVGVGPDPAGPRTDAESGQAMSDSKKWRTIAVGLLIALVVIVAAISLVVYPRTSTENQTVVEWSYYILPAGPNSTGKNSVLIPGFHFCPPSGATTNGLFSLIWRDSTGAIAEEVTLWTLIPPNQGVDNLYLALNMTSGGTSFETFQGGVCGENWILEVVAATPMMVGFTTALTYNITATITSGF
jgi:hypothetical protein